MNKFTKIDINPISCWPGNVWKQEKCDRQTDRQTGRKSSEQMTPPPPPPPYIHIASLSYYPYGHNITMTYITPSVFVITSSDYG